MLAALAFCSACVPSDQHNAQALADAPLRSAARRVAEARSLLLSCFAGARDPAIAAEMQRQSELERLAAGKGAAYSIWAGFNEWNALARAGGLPSCRHDTGAYERALSGYGEALDELARRAAEYRQ
jgi:hypothetical protein